MRRLGRSVTKNDKLTASVLKDIPSQKCGAANVQYSVRAIARLHIEFSWTFTTARSGDL